MTIPYSSILRDNLCCKARLHICLKVIAITEISGYKTGCSASKAYIIIVCALLLKYFSNTTVPFNSLDTVVCSLIGKLFFSNVVAVVSWLHIFCFHCGILMKPWFLHITTYVCSVVLFLPFV